ncbi:MAG: glycosyltransferase family 9 protein [Fibrobacteres bacterium]|nr:glycosyltransferase family 9 protein [Fibrobacterota bacterium]
MNFIPRRVAFGLKYIWLNFLNRELQSKVLCRLSKAHLLRRTISFEDEIHRFKKILIILPERTYDAAIVQSVFSSLKLKKGALVEVVAESDAKDLIKSNPDVDGGFFFSAREYRYNHPAFIELCNAIQQKSYDICFLMKQDAGPLDLLLAAVTKAPLRVGFPSNSAFPFLNLCIRPSKKTEQEKDKYESMLRALGIKILRGKIAWNLPRTADKDAEGVIAETGVHLSNRIVGINLTPAVTGQSFPIQLLKDIIAELESEEGVSTVLFHAGYSNDEEAELAQAVGRKSINYPPHHITFAAALSKKLPVVITLNNLYYQISAMTGNKVLGLFESLEHRRWSSFEAGKLELLSAVKLEKIDTKEIKSKVLELLA